MNAAQNGIEYGYASHTLPLEVTAGSSHTFDIIYTAGTYGIDSSGSLKLVWRYASDMGIPQFDDPHEQNYVEVATNGNCTLVPRYDRKMNVRPWGPTLYVKVTSGYINPGETVTFRFGNRFAGFQMQTFRESAFSFKLLVDPIATYTYKELPVSPPVSIVSGNAATYTLYLPSQVSPGELCSLRITGHDQWANLSPIAHTLTLSSSIKLSGLPDKVGPEDADDQGIITIQGISSHEEGIIRITAVRDDKPRSGPGVVYKREYDTAALSNPMICRMGQTYRPFWGDMHGQSGETIGTGTITQYFRFARDAACLDFTSHQGNDFQISHELWQEIQKNTASYTCDGRFITFPGYEWSGNIPLGGDHNVYFLSEGYPIRRSSHALCAVHTEDAEDCTSIEALYAALKDEPCMIIPHVGGRYADVSRHTNLLVNSVEIHSAWGTFEWMLSESLSRGHRVGVVCASDDHKGRPGASHPGRSHFGSFGGLTCVYAESLTREALWDAYRRRHHYGTTGARIILNVTAAQMSSGEKAHHYDMGSLVEESWHEAHIQIEVHGTGPLASVELYNGFTRVKQFEPARPTIHDRRILVWWSGASERGRDRAYDWSGKAVLEGNQCVHVRPVNFHNPETPLTHSTENSTTEVLAWNSITTGGLSGFIAELADPAAGELTISTADITKTIKIAEISTVGRTWTAGKLDLKLHVRRVTTTPGPMDCTVQYTLPLDQERDAALFVKVTQEDGHMAWSSPLFLHRTSTSYP